MKKLLLIMMLLPLLTTAQLSGGTITPINGVSNAPTSFATIQEAGTYLAANGVTGTGDVVLQMTSAYNSASEPATGIVLDSIPFTNSNRRVIFRPAPSTNITISLNVAGNGTLNLQRVNFVIFDGRAGGVGSSKNLTITNTSTSGTNFTGALKLINSSKNNQFQYITFNGGAALATSSTVFGNAVIMFGDPSTFGVGNNGNKIYRCDVNGNSSALQLLVSRGSTVSPTVGNNRDTIRGCNFFDNYSNLSGNIAINLHQGNNLWLIDSNNIYQTATRTYTVQALHTGINTVLAYTGEAQYITNNFVGGNAPGATGLMTLQGATTNAVGYIAISCQHGEGSLVTNNTIRNITMTYAASAGTFGNAGISVNMQYSSGLTNVGNNNINNISYSNTNGFIRYRSIYLRGVVTATAGTFGNVQPQLFAFNNVLNNITATGSGATGNAELVGFACESASGNSLLGGTCIGQFYIYDNKMTQLTATSATPATGTFVRGIFSFNTQGTSSASSLANYNEIIKDTISGLSTNSTLTSVAPGAATGIFINSGLIDTSTIQQCDISNIANTNAADVSNAVSGITLTNGSWDVGKNRIYELKNASTGATQRASIFGINVRGVNAGSDIHNNQISVGNAQNNNLQVFGIINNFSATLPLNVLYNSIVVTGNPTSGSSSSAAIYRGSDTPSAVIPIVTPFLAQNNLAINTRTGGTGVHSSISNQATSGGFTSDFNTLISTNTAQAGQWGASPQTFAAWKASSTGDVYSYYAQANASSNLSASLAQVNLANLFFTPAYETTGNLGIDSTKTECWLVAGKGKSVPTVSASFNRTVDPAYPPSIGSSEFTPDVDAPCSFASAAPSLSGTTNYTFAGKDIMSITWGNTGTVPTSVCVKYFSGKTFSPVQPATSYSASYWGVTGVGGSGYTYSPTIYFRSSERGTVTFADPSVKQSFFDGAGWNYLGASATANTATNPATSTRTGIAAPYLLGANTAFILTDASSPIPVELMTFTAQRKNGYNLLQWSTAQEMNSQAFVVERSSDGRNFTTIGQVAAAGISSTTTNYSFNDNAPVKGINHYRLRMVDKDNGFKLSLIRHVRNEGVADVTVYPNPVIDKFTVNVQADRAINGQLQIMDISGKILQSRTVKIVQGQNLLAVDAAGLQKGTYIVKMILEEDVVLNKINKL